MILINDRRLYRFMLLIYFFLFTFLKIKNQKKVITLLIHRLFLKSFKSLFQLDMQIVKLQQVFTTTYRILKCQFTVTEILTGSTSRQDATPSSLIPTHVYVYKGQMNEYQLHTHGVEESGVDLTHQCITHQDNYKPTYPPIHTYLYTSDVKKVHSFDTE